MDKHDKLIETINRLGFDEYRDITTEDIIFSEAVFADCARNTCGNYNKNYACPPLSGTLEQNMARMKRFKKAIIINKIISMNTREEIMDGMKLTVSLIKDLRKECDKLEGVFVVGPGGCRLCEKCAAIDSEPCRFPDKTQYSMEGSGINIMQMSREQNMTYNGGERGLGYFYLVMYNDD